MQQLAPIFMSGQCLAGCVVLSVVAILLIWEDIIKYVTTRENREYKKAESRFILIEDQISSKSLN